MCGAFLTCSVHSKPLEHPAASGYRVNEPCEDRIKSYVQDVKNDADAIKRDGAVAELD